MTRGLHLALSIVFSVYILFSDAELYFKIIMAVVLVLNIGYAIFRYWKMREAASGV